MKAGFSFIRKQPAMEALIVLAFSMTAGVSVWLPACNSRAMFFTAARNLYPSSWCARVAVPLPARSSSAAFGKLATKAVRHC